MAITTALRMQRSGLIILAQSRTAGGTLLSSPEALGTTGIHRNCYIFAAANPPQLYLSVPVFDEGVDVHSPRLLRTFLGLAISGEELGMVCGGERGGTPDPSG